MERWLPVFKRAGLTSESEKYEVSSQGRVRNRVTGHILKPRLSKTGYTVVDLGKKTYNIHALVMLTFRGKRPQYMDHPALPPRVMDVNHRNGKRQDARLRNLEWATRTENIRHALRLRGGANRDF